VIFAVSTGEILQIALVAPPVEACTGCAETNISDDSNMSTDTIPRILYSLHGSVRILADRKVRLACDEIRSAVIDERDRGVLSRGKPLAGGLDQAFSVPLDEHLLRHRDPCDGLTVFLHLDASAQVHVRV